MFKTEGLVSVSFISVCVRVCVRVLRKGRVGATEEEPEESEVDLLDLTAPSLSGR